MTDESRLYTKAMGIEKARKLHEPMPNNIKIPKRSRLSSSGGRCYACDQNTLEGHEDSHGIWHYRCQYCVDHQKPDPNPCPRCRCTAHSETYRNDLFDSKNPFKPDVEYFECCNCEFKWITPEFEKFLLTKAVVSVTDNSSFLENKRNVK